jgi:hypothetical protein
MSASGYKQTFGGVSQIVCFTLNSGHWMSALRIQRNKYQTATLPTCLTSRAQFAFVKRSGRAAKAESHDGPDHGP